LLDSLLQEIFSKKLGMTDEQNVVHIGIDPNNGLQAFINSVETAFGCTISLNKLFGVKSEVDDPPESKSTFHEDADSFKCELCDKSYSSVKNLERHRAEKHGNNVLYQCELCPYKASWPSGLKRHVQLIHETESCPSHQCSDCNFSTKYKQSLKEHIQSFHLNPDNCNKVCVECNRTFISKRGYTQHMKAYHVKGSTRKNSAQPQDGELHRCSECDYTSKIKSYLLRHFKTNHGTASFMCDTCGNEYRTNKQLKCHLRDKHSGIAFSCELCSFKSPRFREVLRHKVRVHDKTSPDYTCEYCGFTTKYKQTLQDHMQSVHDDKIFSCDDCVYTSKNKRSLVKHRQRCSGRSFPCNLCQDTFVTEKLHRVHMRNTHGQVESFKCDSCDYITSKKGNLVKHQVSIHGYIVQTRKYKKRSEVGKINPTLSISSASQEDSIKEDSIDDNSASRMTSPLLSRYQLPVSSSSADMLGFDKQQEPLSHLSQSQPWYGVQTKASPNSSPGQESGQANEILKKADQLGVFTHPVFPWQGLHLKDPHSFQAYANDYSQRKDGY